MDIRFIDLFAGIGGIRKGLEQAIFENGDNPICVFTSEIKPYAVNILKQNHPKEEIFGDITKIDTIHIPEFDILCAGFPCQAFSSAGCRRGFSDTRGTMFFEVERILKAHKPKGFILENVEGLVNHDKGNTLSTIYNRLTAIGYKVSYKVLNAKDFGVPQNRKRIYIVGTFGGNVDLEHFPVKSATISDIQDVDMPTESSPFINKLLATYSLEQLKGKSIKDKRGGSENIHSWDIELKGEISKEEKDFLNKLMTERRKKKWALEWGIDWMDGMPLTKKMIQEFYDVDNLDNILANLVRKKYLKLEHPKKLIVDIDVNGNKSTHREYDFSKPEGYNIVTGKLSFEISKILSPNDIAPTLVATDACKIYIADNGGLRKLSLREGLRLFGYPEDFHFDDISMKEGFDLIGNTVVVPVIKAVAHRLLSVMNS